MVGHVIVWNGNGSRSHDSINKSISTMGEWIVINPYMARAKNWYGITISHCPPPIVSRWAPNHGITSGFTVVNVKTMNDHVGHKLDSDTTSIGNVHICPTTINGLEAINNQFLFQLNHHVPLEDNPERPILDSSMAQSSRFGVNRVIIPWVSDNIEATITTTNGISSKTNATVRKTLAILVPVAVTAPAVINGITSTTGEVPQLSPFSAVAGAPEIISNLLLLWKMLWIMLLDLNLSKSNVKIATK